jgi:hypothetical protein
MVLSFGISHSLLVINFIAICGVELCSVLDFINFDAGYIITWAACNSEMYFDLCVSPLYKMSHSNSPECM